MFNDWGDFWQVDYMQLNSLYVTNELLGYYNDEGNDSSSMSYEGYCRAFYGLLADLFCGEVDDDDYSWNKKMGPGMRGMSLNMIYYFMQLNIEDRFQDYIPMDRYIWGERWAPEIDLSKITDIPVHFLSGENDTTSPIGTARRLYE